MGRLRIGKLLLVVFVVANCATALAREIGPEELAQIGRRIWENECNGTVAGLTSWNSGEKFASLGIGHFIWYPTGTTGPFEESFPMLLAYFNSRGVAVPAWLTKAQGCPWPNRAAFLKDKDSPRQQELRKLLSSTVTEQTLFILSRLDASTRRMQAAAGQYSSHVTKNIQMLRQTAAGSFAMIDYVNFKGDGLSRSESYKGQGWGLLHVLIAMQPDNTSDAPRAFAEASKAVLRQRVKNSPPERGEEKWLPGWLNRCERYAR